MKLSDYQKMLVKLIAERKIIHFENFIFDYAGFKEIKEPDDKTVILKTYKDSRRSTIYRQKNVSLDNYDDVINNLNSYIALIYELDKSGLIKLVRDEKHFFYESINDDMIFDKLTKLRVLSGDYSFHGIIKLPSIEIFIENKYKTNDEIKFEEQINLAKRSLKNQTYVMLVTIAIALGVTIFNYLTYTTERQIIIKNIDSFPDTNKVLLLNPLIIDTSSSKNGLLK